MNHACSNLKCYYTWTATPNQNPCTFTITHHSVFVCVSVFVCSSHASSSRGVFFFSYFSCDCGLHLLWLSDIEKKLTFNPLLPVGSELGTFFPLLSKIEVFKFQQLIPAKFPGPEIESDTLGGLISFTIFFWIQYLSSRLVLFRSWMAFFGIWIRTREPIQRLAMLNVFWI